MVLETGQRMGDHAGVAGNAEQMFVEGLIEFAGLGVAMANASKDIQDKADFITYSNEEDGVAHVVDKFIFNK